jgi:hypothetical protein
VTYPENLGSQPGAAFDLAATALQREVWPDRQWPPAVDRAGLIDPDCAAGKHSSCVGGPCECDCHRVRHVIDDDEGEDS